MATPPSNVIGLLALSTREPVYLLKFHESVFFLCYRAPRTKDRQTSPFAD